MQRIRLDQHAGQVHALQKFPQGSGFAAGIGGVGGLGDRHAKRLGVEAHLGDESGCTLGGFRNRSTQRLAVAHQSVEALRDTRLARHPALEERLKGVNIQLGEELPEGGIGRRLAEIRASSSLGTWRWRLAKRSIPTREPWPLRMARIATSSIHHWENRMPRRMRQSGKALRKQIRSLAAAGSAGREDNGAEQFPRTPP